jgi:hypothetical protein
LLGHALVPLVAVIALDVMPAAAQDQAVPGAGGTVALEGTMQKFYRGINTIAVMTIDGVEHVYTFTKRLIVHGGKGSGGDALQGLREGSTVVVHSTTDGAGQTAREIDVVGEEGLKETEAVVTHVNRRKKQITIRIDGKTETLRLTERAAGDSGKDVDPDANGETRVVVYYSDEAGHKVVHYFRKTS